MKKNVFLLCVMMVAMMAASVGLTSCSKDDDGGSTGGGTLSDLTGTWISVNKQEKVIYAALTFSSNGKSVDVLLEGAWFVCTVERTADKMVLKGDQILMVNFDDFGNFIAKPGKSNITITFNYKRNGTKLIIDNITMDPKVASFSPRYEFEYDRIYNGTVIIL